MLKSAAQLRLIFSCVLNRNIMHHAKRTKMNDLKDKSDAAERAENMVWVDLEMSGLNIDKDHILEIACLITDAQLNIIAEAPNIIVHQPDHVLDGMDDWCKEHHVQSGLTLAVKNSRVSLESAEQQMLMFLQKHTPRGRCPLAGNSVHEDRRFLKKYMPNFMSHLHYRIIDVSTIKELCRRWYPKDFTNVSSKKGSHRALDDIKESIAELQFYRKTIFKVDDLKKDT